MKQRKLILIIVVVLFILLFPIKKELQDGGSKEYTAILYKVTKYNELDKINENKTVTEGKNNIEIKIFPFNYLK